MLLCSFYVHKLKFFIFLFFFHPTHESSVLLQGFISGLHSSGEMKFSERKKVFIWSCTSNILLMLWHFTRLFDACAVKHLMLILVQVQPLNLKNFEFLKNVWHPTLGFFFNTFIPKILLLILPSGCYTFPCKLFGRIWCKMEITTSTW